jgi:hypothetical protein
MANIPKPAHDDDSSGEFNTFLKVMNIGTGKPGAKATVLLTGETRMAESQFGEQIVCEVKLAGKLYDWGIKIDTPNHRMLYDRFGANPKKWRGKVEIVVNPPTRAGFRPYLSVAKPK